MNRRVIEHVPVEIWTMILRKAISSPIFPFLEEPDGPLDSGIHYNLGLFLYECELYRGIREAERTTTTLRLVCRSWNSILLHFRPICIITNCGATNYPSKDIRTLEAVKRIHVAVKDVGLFCSCEISEVEGPCFYELPAGDPSTRAIPGWWEDLENENFKALLSGVRILSLDNWSIDIRKLISLTPNIQALWINFPYKTYTPATYSLSTLLSSHSQLSHLQLSTLRWSIFCDDFSPQLSLLRSLRYLDLHLEAYNPVDREVEWNIPGLESLCIRGNLSFEVKEEVDNFIQQCGRTIKEFVYLLSYDGPMTTPIDPPLESRFPRLRTYGSDLDSIKHQLNEFPPSKPRHSRNLLIYYFNLGFDEYGAPLAGPLISYMRRWSFNSVLLLTSWSDMKSSYDNTPSSLSYIFEDFFGEFMKTDLKLFDADGIELRSPLCSRFWENNSFE
jgi:hypothetical protein